MNKSLPIVGLDPITACLLDRRPNQLPYVTDLFTYMYTCR